MNDRIKALKNVAALARKFLDTVPAPIPIGWQVDMHTVEELIKEADDADGIPAQKAKLATEVLEPFHIETVMAISTSHVEQKTMELLLADEIVAVNAKPFGEEGVMVYVTPDAGAWSELCEDNAQGMMPAELFLAMAHARAHGCTWLLLDSGAADLDELKQYDW